MLAGCGENPAGVELIWACGGFVRTPKHPPPLPAPFPLRTGMKNQHTPTFLLFRPGRLILETGMVIRKKSFLAKQMEIFILA